jgi:hypothetical protein
MKANATFWVRNSIIWNKIHGIVEDQQKNIKAIETYLVEVDKLK